MWILNYIQFWSTTHWSNNCCACDAVESITTSCPGGILALLLLWAVQIPSACSSLHPRDTDQIHKSGQSGTKKQTHNEDPDIPDSCAVNSIRGGHNNVKEDISFWKSQIKVGLWVKSPTSCYNQLWKVHVDGACVPHTGWIGLKGLPHQLWQRVALGMHEGKWSCWRWQN